MMNALRKPTPEKAILLGCVLFAAAGISAPAGAQTYTLVDSLTISGLSADGTVACGNSTDGNYEPCRWTAADGLVRLGRASAPVIGGSAGFPGISRDGLAISSTIIASTDTAMTPGLWTKGTGWTEAMPPLPPDGGYSDHGYGTCWGISGDGSTVVGTYNRPGGDPSTQACKWNAVDGIVDLGNQGYYCRANKANHDGSVVVGWSARYDGAWQPTVWEDGGLTVLEDTDWSCQVYAINDDGNIVAGTAVDTVTFAFDMRALHVWKRNGEGWDKYLLGNLPGTFSSGQAVPRDMTNDGKIIVGINLFDSGQSYAGFVWTEYLGLMEADDFFEMHGAATPPDFTVFSVTAVSDDGLTYAGFGRDPAVWNAPLRSFVVTLPAVTDVRETPAPPGLAVSGIHPNPFNPSTTIRLAVTDPGRVRLEVHDVRGLLVRVVHDGWLEAGNHGITWDGRDAQGRPAASGVYFARAHASGEITRSRPMTLVK